MITGGTIPLVESQLNTKKKMRLGLVSHAGNPRVNPQYLPERGGEGKKKKMSGTQVFISVLPDCGCNAISHVTLPMP